MRLIDSHFHIGFNGYDSPEDIIRYMDERGISKCWLLSWEEQTPQVPERYQCLSVDEIWRAYQKYPDRFVPFYAPDPTRQDALAVLNAWLEKGCRGFGELKVSIGWQDDRLRRILEVLNQRKAILIFHMEDAQAIKLPATSNWFHRFVTNYYRPTRIRGIPYLLLNWAAFCVPGLGKKIKKATRDVLFDGYLNSFDELEQVVKQYANIVFVGHGPLFWKGISSDYRARSETNPPGPVTEGGPSLRLLRDYPNMMADLSGPSGFHAVTRDSEFTRQLLEDCQDKLMYGTDNFDFGLKAVLDSVQLDDAVREKIYSLNAENLLKRVQ